MKSNLPYIKEHATYPGEYMPMPQADLLLKLVNEEGGAKPLLNMIEYTDYYKLEVNIPGAKREDIYINVKDRILSVTVLFLAYENHQHGFQLQEFRKRSIKRHVLLPTDADTAFVSAEYKDGIVYLLLPKSQQDPVPGMQRIVVY